MGRPAQRVRRGRRPIVPNVTLPARRSGKGKAITVGSFGGGFQSIRGNTGQNRLPENQDPAEQIKHFKHWIYAAVNKRATAVAQAKLRVYERLPDGERREVMADEPGAGKLVRLFEKPNPHQTMWQLLYKNQVFADLTGDYYLFKEFNTLGRILSLWTLMPQGMDVGLDDHGIEEYIYRPAGRGSEKEFEAHEIAHGLYPDPESEVYGVGPLQAATEAVNVHRSIHEAQDKSFQQGILPDLVLEGAGEMEDEDIEALRIQLNAKYQGTANAGMALILTEGIKAKPWTINPKELNFLASGAMNRDELLGIFSTPAALLGLSEDVNRSSADAMEYIFAKWTVTPLLVQWQQLLTEKVCIVFDPRLFCEFDSVIPADEDAESARRTERIESGRLSPNEAREEEGAEPSADPAMDKFYMKSNLLPIGTNVEGEEVEEPEPETDVDEPGDEVAEETASGPVIAKVKPVFLNKQLDFDADDFVAIALEWELEAEEFAERMDPQYRDAYRAGVVANASAVGVGVGDIPDMDPFVDAFLRGKDFKYFDFLLEATRDSLGSSLADGVAKGETFKQLTQRIADVYTGQDTRAERIARTEVGHAQNAGGQQVRTTLDVPFKEWVTAFVNSRETHESADGQIVGNDQSFSVGGSFLMYPRDLAGGTAETVNCQCDAVGSFTRKGLTNDIKLAFALISKEARTKIEKSARTVIRKYFRRQRNDFLAAFNDEFGEES